MSEEKFKLPRSSYEELTKIIKAYAQFQEPATLDDVSKTVGLNPTIISANVGFLVGTEILEGGAKKQPTTKGKSLGRALDHDMPDEIRNHWRVVVQDCDFLTRLVTAVRIRRGMDDATLQSHIAYSAGQPKKSYIMTGTRTVIDILRAAGFLEEKDGKLTAVDQNFSESELRSSAGASTEKPLMDSPIVFEQRDPPGKSFRVNVNIAIKIECTPDNLDGLGARIREVIDDLSNDSAVSVTHHALDD